LRRGGPGRVLVLGDVAVGQAGMVLDMPVAQRLVGRQMLPGGAVVVVDVPALDPGVLRRVTVDEPGGRSRVLKRHTAHLAWSGTLTLLRVAPGLDPLHDGRPSVPLSDELQPRLGPGRAGVAGGV